MGSEKNAFAIIGTAVDSLDDWNLRVDPECLLVIGKNGYIVFKGNATKDNVDLIKERYSIEESEIIRLETKNEFLLPGFIDSHIHASQYANLGLGLDRGLLDWLEHYTFPLESVLSRDMDQARTAYERTVETTLAYGTTSAAYFATIGRETTQLLCDIAESQGQRALVGKVCMNRNSKADYQETTQNSLKETDLFLSEIFSRKSRIVEPVITPRFVPTCDQELLIGLGDLAKKYESENVRIQTHLSECWPEMLWVKELEPWAKNYTEVYAKAGLLTDRTILAHTIHANTDEIATIKNAGSGISHCPNSNVSLGAGSFDIVRVRESGVKVGLGTDCSGGYSPSMLDSMRFAIATANFIQIQRKEKDWKLGQGEKFSPTLDFKGALFLATRGSAQVASLDELVGCFEVGKKFDALRIRMGNSSFGKARSNLITELFGFESAEDIVQKFIHVGDDRNIVQVFVNGLIRKNLLD